MRFTARLKQHDLCKICEHLHTWPLKKEGSGQLGFQTDWSAASQLGDCMTWLPTCMSMYEHVVALVFCWLLCWLFFMFYMCLCKNSKQSSQRCKFVEKCVLQDSVCLALWVTHSASHILCTGKCFTQPITSAQTNDQSCQQYC